MTGRFLNSLYFWCWILKVLSVGSGWKQYWYVVKFCFLVEGSGYLKPDTTSLVVNRQMLNHFSGYTAGSGIQTDIWLPSKKYKLSEDQLYILLLKNYQWETKPSFNIIGNFAHKREKEYHNENWTRTASVRPEEGRSSWKYLDGNIFWYLSGRTHRFRGMIGGWEKTSVTRSSGAEANGWLPELSSYWFTFTFFIFDFSYFLC